jgi:hypothetical protein
LNPILQQVAAGSVRDDVAQIIKDSGVPGVSVDDLSNEIAQFDGMAWKQMPANVREKTITIMAKAAAFEKMSTGKLPVPNTTPRTPAATAPSVNVPTATTATTLTVEQSQAAEFLRRNNQFLTDAQITELVTKKR